MPFFPPAPSLKPAFPVGLCGSRDGNILPVHSADQLYVCFPIRHHDLVHLVAKLLRNTLHGRRKSVGDAIEQINNSPDLAVRPVRPLHFDLLQGGSEQVDLFSSRVAETSELPFALQNVAKVQRRQEVFVVQPLPQPQQAGVSFLQISPYLLAANDDLFFQLIADAHQPLLIVAKNRLVAIPLLVLLLQDSLEALAGNHLCPVTVQGRDARDLSKGKPRHFISN
eukprot:scaffold1435_cov267-Pinguiococcus_pyrenoidosus.AAC.3